MGTQNPPWHCQDSLTRFYLVCPAHRMEGVGATSQETSVVLGHQNFDVVVTLVLRWEEKGQSRCPAGVAGVQRWCPLNGPLLPEASRGRHSSPCLGSSRSVAEDGRQKEAKEPGLDCREQQGPVWGRDLMQRISRLPHKGSQQPPMKAGP